MIVFVVDFVDFSSFTFELLFEILMHFVVACNDHETTRVFVEPMHDAGSRRVVSRREACNAVAMQQAVHERAALVAGAWMHREAVGLVDNDEVPM